MRLGQTIAEPLTSGTGEAVANAGDHVSRRLRQTIRRSLSQVITLLSVLTVTAACGTDNRPQQAEEAAIALATMQPALDAIGAAESVLVAACARDHGFPVRPGTPEPQPAETVISATPPPTEPVATKIGYGVAVRILNAQTSADMAAWAAA